jgi:hypothetical protein
MPKKTGEKLEERGLSSARLEPEDKAKAVKLAEHLTKKLGVVVTHSDVVRMAIRKFYESEGLK